VRVNLESSGENDPAKAGHKLQSASTRVARLGWHVQTYTNLTVLKPLTDVIMQLPTPLVVDHFGLAQAALGTGQPGFAELLQLLRSGKIYVKISAAYRISNAPDDADAAPTPRPWRAPSSRPTPITSCGAPTGRTPAAPGVIPPRSSLSAASTTARH
jgi:predicted TIM-barrel fold metal-dependent hydrolase